MVPLSTSLKLYPSLVAGAQMERCRAHLEEERILQALALARQAGAHLSLYTHVVMLVCSCLLHTHLV